MPFERALPFLRAFFEKPQVATSGNPNRLRAADPVVDALLALLLPLDIRPKNFGNNAASVPASCRGPVGGAGQPDQNSIYLPSFHEQPGGVARRQRCEYFSGTTGPDDREVEEGLGCVPAKPSCFTNPGAGATGDPLCFADLDRTVDPPVCTATTCRILCTETPRGMAPVDLDVSADYATPLELFIPLLRRSLAGVYPDPVAGDGIDPDSISFDFLPVLELLAGQTPALSDGEAVSLGGEATMTALLERVALLAKVLSAASDAPGLGLYRFFPNKADASCSGAPLPGAKCDATTADLFEVLSAFMEPVALRDRVTGIVGPSQPIIVRLADHYIDAFFPDVSVPPTLAARDAAPRISLARESSDILIWEGYGTGAADDPRHCAEFDGLNHYFRADCVYYLDLTAYHGQIGGTAEEFPGAVVTIRFPDDVEAGSGNALHVSGFNEGGTSRGSILAMRLWNGSYTVAAGAADNDTLEYGILIPSISHVASAGINAVTSTIGSCVTGGHGVFEPETARQFEQLSDASRDCFRNNALSFANKTDQAGRPAEPAYELADAKDKFLFRRVLLRRGNPNADEGDFGGKTLTDLYLEFDTSKGGGRGRAEAYVSFVRITDPVKPFNAPGCLNPQDPSDPGNPDKIVPYCLKLNVYNGGTALPAGAGAIAAQTGYSGLDEVNTCAGLPGACTGTGSPALNVRRTGILCPAAPAGCASAPASGCSASDLDGAGPGSGFRCANAPDGALRVKADSSGRIILPVLASQIPHRVRIDTQIRCGDSDADGDCDAQEIGTPAELEIRRAGDSAPVTYSIWNRYPSRPLALSFETPDKGHRPVYQSNQSGPGGSIADPTVENVKAGEPLEDDAFFVDTRVVDQSGLGFAGYPDLPCKGIALPNVCDPGSTAPLGAIGTSPVLNYAVVHRPALQLRANYTGASLTGNNALSLNVLGTGDPGSTGPYISQAGDYLEYEVYIPSTAFGGASTGNTTGDGASNTAPNAGIDIQSALPNNGSRDLRDATILGAPSPSDAVDRQLLVAASGNAAINGGRALDQNLRSADPRVELASQGAPAAGANFYYRRIPLPEGFVLSRNDSDFDASRASRVFASFWARLPSATNDLSDAYFREIRIGSAGKPRYSVFDGSAGAKLIRLSSSPCNDFNGGVRSALCPSVTPATCPDGPDADTNPDPGFALVFDEATGLQAAGVAGNRVILLNGRPPCWGSHNHGAGAVTHDAPCAVPGEIGELEAKSTNADAGLSWTQIYRNAALAAVSNPRLFEACDVGLDPVVVFKGAPPAGDWTNGAALRATRQRTSRPHCEIQRNALSVPSGQSECLEDNSANPDPEISAGYTNTALCLTTAFGRSDAADENRCQPVAAASGQIYGQAVGEGRFCPNGTNPDQYGQRCPAGNMYTVSASDGPAVYTAGSSHVVQQPKPVISDPGLYRFLYTMGVSSGVQRIDVRTDNSSGTIGGLPSEVRPYAYLLAPSEFSVVATPPPVPSQIVFNRGDNADTNKTMGAPCDFTYADGCPAAG
ncbi:MAG: hypothetical protein AB1405_14175, partial [Bdellovibrionota bacterium]